MIDAPQRGPARGSAAQRRSVARLLAVQALYQIELNRLAPSSAEIDAVVGEFVKHRLGQEIEGEHLGEADRTLFIDIVRGASARQGDLDGMLAGALTEEWPIHRLETILRAILRAGTYELSARPDIPPRVVISEYLDVAHAFFAGKEPAMVNGVLDRLARLLRPEDLGSDRGGTAPR
ncbi:MAG: transcription antitermination factor NusB [Alphaproteobacteria bacterium]|nr:transcription antitermination factor NusB [Alphaproteobacteria bacterium]